MFRLKPVIDVDKTKYQFSRNHCRYDLDVFNLSHLLIRCQTVGPKNRELLNLKRMASFARNQPSNCDYFCTSVIFQVPDIYLFVAETKAI